MATDSLSPTLIEPSSEVASLSPNLSEAQQANDDGTVPSVSSPPQATTQETDEIVPSPSPPSIHEDASPANDSDPAPVPSTPRVSITLLLVSGRRRAMEFEPKITIGEMKEMVWSTWPADWSDELPPSAAFLRILYLGRILTDDTTITSLNLPEPPESTVVHVSVRSFAPTASDEDLKKKPKKRGTMRRGRSIPVDTGNATVEARESAEPETEETGGCCGGCVIC